LRAKEEKKQPHCQWISTPLTKPFFYFERFLKLPKEEGLTQKKKPQVYALWSQLTLLLIVRKLRKG
jgi:hypothetical protein